MLQHPVRRQRVCRLANLCFGRWCGLWTGPLRRYAQAFSMQRMMPDLAITNHMNYEAILQVPPVPALWGRALAPCPHCWPEGLSGRRVTVMCTCLHDGHRQAPAAHNRCPCLYEHDDPAGASRTSSCRQAAALSHR